MSNCSITLEFDNPERRYKFAEKKLQWSISLKLKFVKSYFDSYYYLCQGTRIGGKNTVEAVRLGKCQGFSFNALN